MVKPWKIRILILIIISLTPDILISREVPDSTGSVLKFSMGLRAGLYLSGFKSTGDDSHPMRGVNVTDENNMRAGYSFGVYLDFKSKNHFSIQPEINLIRFKHNIHYLTLTRKYTYQESITDYELTCSVLQLCLLPKFIIGHDSEIKIMIGPSIRLPLATRYSNVRGMQDEVEGGIGAIIGMKIDLPVKSDFVCIEIRGGTDLRSIMSTPVPIKETSLSLGLSYLFGVKMKY